MGLRIVLHNEEDTEILGRTLANTISEFLTAEGRLPLGAVYLYGDLGSGKTTLVRAVVGALPGGEAAEAASPSFTLCNEYPTIPPLLHADLYRLGAGASLPDEMEDGLEDGGLLLLEWAEFLTPEARQADCLDIRLAGTSTALAAGCHGRAENLDIPGQSCEKTRLADICSHGNGGAIFLDRLRKKLAGSLETDRSPATDAPVGVSALTLPAGE